MTEATADEQRMPKWFGAMVRNVLATIPLGVALAVFLWNQGAKDAATEARMTSVERRLDSVATEQAAGRARGDASRNAIAELQRGVAVLQSQMASANTKLDVVDNKLDRLIERRFGAASQPTGGLSPEPEGQPWQR